MIKKSATFFLLASAAAIITTWTAGGVSVVAQVAATVQPDLTGQWQLNRDLSDDAQEKLQNMGGSGRVRRQRRWRASGARTVGRGDPDRANQVRLDAGRSEGRPDGTRRTRANAAHA